MKTITVLGIDLAKEVFQLHGVNQHGKAIFKKQIKRDKLLETIAGLPACLIGMEACGSAHFWAREFIKLGHDVKIMAPQFVKPYVKTQKNDATDAEAIAEAVSRPNMRFVPIKQVWQQDIQSLHRVRQRLVKNKTALINELHGLMLEYGIALPLLASKMTARIASLLDPENNYLSAQAKETFQLLIEELNQIELRLESFNQKIEIIAKGNEEARRLQTVPGIGPITATAIIAAVADVSSFKNGRQLAAWLGLVPRQYSSGGKQVLGRITKRGDVYLRSLLVHGGRSLMRTLNPDNPNDFNQWALQKKLTKGANRTAVAIANKNARIVWALLKNKSVYEYRYKKAA